MTIPTPLSRDIVAGLHKSTLELLGFDVTVRDLTEPTSTVKVFDDKVKTVEGDASTRAVAEIADKVQIADDVLPPATTLRCAHFRSN